LIALWTASADQALVTLVVHQIEMRLRLNPLRTGESRDSSVSRLVLASPVGLWFEVIEDDQKVLVISVWSIP
jgi:hypothetical protein